ncbi:hypothetical protein [Nitratireductor sp. ZSWI3]|uniref:hypothetical protein n=1 Tax=Nitratireductor sp. ZSWI3 TaxID=2966359 RepID=UPI00215031BF|nr:hypothetical protein [Nitratireductor sp. ZSWI3]MCR4267839.1 hypothetical protein [Nitratireductor sp. ZSWI3]
MKQIRLNRRSFIAAAAYAAATAARPALAGEEGSDVLPSPPDAGSRIALVGDFGYRQYEARDLPSGTIVDATAASFSLANSRNAHPMPGAGCEVGRLPLNAYPVVMRNCPSVRFVGGRFAGEVPLSSAWRETYCNSAALLLRDGSSASMIEGVRVRRCWDGVRFSEGTQDFRLRGCWLSDVRDDAVENDYLYGGAIEDCLFDGCFSGISLDPGSKERDGSDRLLAVEDCLILMKPFPTERGVSHGSPFKTADGSPRLRLVGTVLALSAANMRRRRLKRTWARLTECRDNLLLWLPQTPIPRDFPLPPSGFEVVAGEAAYQLWDRLRRSWIDSHPRVARFQDDV